MLSSNKLCAGLLLICLFFSLFGLSGRGFCRFVRPVSDCAATARLRSSSSSSRQQPLPQRHSTPLRHTGETKGQEGRAGTRNGERPPPPACLLSPLPSSFLPGAVVPRRCLCRSAALVGPAHRIRRPPYSRTQHTGQRDTHRGEGTEQRGGDLHCRPSCCMLVSGPIRCLCELRTRAKHVSCFSASLRRACSPPPRPPAVTPLTSLLGLALERTSCTRVWSHCGGHRAHPPPRRRCIEVRPLSPFTPRHLYVLSASAPDAIPSSIPCRCFPRKPSCPSPPPSRRSRTHGSRTRPSPSSRPVTSFTRTRPLSSSIWQPLSAHCTTHTHHPRNLINCARATVTPSLLSPPLPLRLLQPA